MLLDILGKIGFDWQVALANLINFLIIFFILKRFAFGPIKDLIAKRQQVIQEGLANRDTAVTLVAKAEEQAEELTKTAQQQANAIVAEAHEKGKAMVASAEQDARTAQERIKHEFEAALAQEKEAMVKEVRKASGELIVGALEKVLQEDVDEATKQKAAETLARTHTR